MGGNRCSIDWTRGPTAELVVGDRNKQEEEEEEYNFARPKSSDGRLGEHNAGV